ncbi:unnamed protein product [Soboliphyme baturini]|uniref:aspartyl aminopeptidase n=1 Tax=Soboliphyme baturini TaxID=241478 RepID=A0A183IDF0_9BILA|nr:unnamed protein product [Soboliphyme baturini]
MGIHTGEIVDFDLCVIDTQPACLGGLKKEFVFGGHLDNLVGTFCAITALIKATETGLESNKNPAVHMVAAFDNEECGSESAQGARSAWMQWILRQINADSLNTTAFEQSIGNSFLLSADEAHAVNPNYVSKYEANHQPRFHKGVVVKINANQRYATTAITSSMLKDLAKMAKVPLQAFVVRNDSTCGTTVGPILAADLGIETVDVGTPMLCMHSIREVTDTTGLYYAQQLFKVRFRRFRAFYANLWYKETT